MVQKCSSSLFVYVCFLCGFIMAAQSVEVPSWECEIVPNESERYTDPVTGASVLFVTTHESQDSNLYFHNRSWIADESLLIFTSDRTGQQEPFGYIEKTGELVRLCPGDGIATSGYLAGKQENSLFLIKSGGVYEWKINLSFPQPQKTRVSVQERKIGALPPGALRGGDLNENADGTRLSLLLIYENSPRNDVVFFDKTSGEITTLATLNWRAGHLQCSWTNPDQVMFSRSYADGGDMVPMMSDEEYAAREQRARLWFADTSDRAPWTLFYQRPGELVTHECWWLNDTITFCGGFLPEESHVKTIDFHTGQIRIIGAGAWLPESPPAELAKRNWWHAAGSPTGEWVAADNWHGDIVLFNARTTQMRPLTMGHRTYGGGQHPHVGWDPSGDRVVFASNRRGNADVCVTHLRSKR